MNIIMTKKSISFLVRNALIVGFISVAGATPPVNVPAAGGLPQCQSAYNSCTIELGACMTNLDTCQSALTRAQKFPSSGNTDDGGAGSPLDYSKVCSESGDCTIIDNNTRLMWEVKTESNVDQMFDWDGTFNYIEELNSVLFAGYDDWRLPDVKELQSIVDYGQPVMVPHDPIPAIRDVFGPTARGYYGTSTFPTGVSVGGKWVVDFASGYVKLIGTGDEDRHVRAVRGPVWPE